MGKPQRINLGVSSSTQIDECITLDRDDSGFYTLRNYRNNQEFFFGYADDALSVLKDAARAVRANVKVLGG